MGVGVVVDFFLFCSKKQQWLLEVNQIPPSIKQYTLQQHNLSVTLINLVYKVRSVAFCINLRRAHFNRENLVHILFWKAIGVRIGQKYKICEKPNPFIPKRNTTGEKSHWLQCIITLTPVGNHTMILSFMETEISPSIKLN